MNRTDMCTDICEVHSIPLTKGKAEVVYGLWCQEQTLAERQLFPNHNLRVPGGCLYDRDWPTRQASHSAQRVERLPRNGGRFLGRYEVSKSPRLLPPFSPARRRMS